MEFMRDGGFAMWIMLVLALATGGVELAGRGRAALAGAVATIGLGLVGYGTGMRNVVEAVATFEPGQQMEIMEIGTREAGNNLILAGALAVVLVIVHAARSARA